MAIPHGAPGSAASHRMAVFVGQGRSLGAPPPCVHCDHAPSDPSAAATPVVLDLDPLQLAAMSIDTFMSSYDDLLAKHQQALRDLTTARRPNERAPYVVFAKQSNAKPRQPKTTSCCGLRYKASRIYALVMRCWKTPPQRRTPGSKTTQWGLVNSQHSSLADPSGASPSLVQDLRDLRDENMKLRQRNVVCESRCRTANADRDKALKDHFRLQKDRTDLQRCYEQRKLYIRDLEREVQRLKEGLHHARQRLEGSASAADLQTLRRVVHVRGERVIQLENFLAKAERRREDSSSRPRSYCWQAGRCQP
ncbi:hypothetical protein PHYPSEUDO_009361 [Phytophthora pseudosyringae]|uniref:Uncharacterized protein n=1 Tax=Phytophthora pseudosyringae TaxID=221518 RepID=A0A8T1WAU6_9STRA|nr:hypothetical protein PHYPSEUDO_009361 [Phytophthora pseudosyringae]